jgi:hypothetical protein
VIVAFAVNFSPIENHPIEGIVILDAANILAIASPHETVDDSNSPRFLLISISSSQIFLLISRQDLISFSNT